jgi:hypothetical protein
MNTLIPKLNDMPDVARAAIWRDLIGCSERTMERVERAGTLIPSGTRSQKLYTKKAILRWLGIQE